MNTDRRLALDVMSLLRNGGNAPKYAWRRLCDDKDLCRFLNALDDETWDDFRRYIRRQRIGVSEVDAVRLSLPEWRAQGRLLAAVKVAMQEKEQDKPANEDEGDVSGGEEVDKLTADIAPDFGGGFGHGA